MIVTVIVIVIAIVIVTVIVTVIIIIIIIYQLEWRCHDDYGWKPEGNPYSKQITGWPKTKTKLGWRTVERKLKEKRIRTDWKQRGNSPILYLKNGTTMISADSWHKLAFNQVNTYIWTLGIVPLLIVPFLEVLIVSRVLWVVEMPPDESWCATVDKHK